MDRYRPATAQHRELPQTWWLRWYGRLVAAWYEFLGLVLSVECVCCLSADSLLCSDCARLLRALTSSPFHAAAYAPALTSVDGVVLLPVVAAGPYRDQLARAILAFKNQGAVPLADHLAMALGRALDTAIFSSEMGFGNSLAGELPLLVPVPMTSTGFRRRGYDPLQILLHALRRRGALYLPVAKILRHRRKPLWQAILAPKAAQKALSATARRANLRGSLVVIARRHSCIQGRSCVLVDDVLTTGATLAEAARAVAEAGGTVLGAVVLAAVSRNVQRVPRKYLRTEDE